MGPRDEPQVTCAVCRKAMQLRRTVAAPALGKGFEFQYWECVWQREGHHGRATGCVTQIRHAAPAPANMSM
jgi:hypothetical protein